MKIITVANRKGGTGKTTTTYNLAFSLALQNKRVCLLDLDSQANLSLICEAELNSIDSFKGSHTQSLNDYIDIIAACEEFSILENEINNLVNRNAYLKKSLLPNILNNNYDYLLIDTSPSFNILNINALSITDTVLIVINADYFSISGLNRLMGIIEDVREVNEKIEYKIIINDYIDNRKYSKQLLPILEKIEGFTDIKIPTRQAFIDNSSLHRPSIDIKDIAKEYNKLIEVIG